MKGFASSFVVALALAGAAAGAASAATAPANTAPPTVAGTAEQGQTLTAATGSWSGDAPISYTFAWQRCSGSGGSCGDISGATSQTYVVTSGDVGKTIRIVVAAANSAGRSSAASSPTGTVPAPATPPSPSKQPDPHGTAQVGQTVSVDDGSWHGTAPFTFTYQWQRCSASGTCTSIGGATKSTYVPASGDVGYRLRATVTARNSAGSASIVSNVTSAIVAAGARPAVTKQPDPHGTAQVGLTVTVDNGTWSGTTPITYAYQWQRCSASGACTSIGGATASSYVPAAGDAGYRLRATVAAKNSVGSASVASNLTAAVVASAAPANTARPTVGVPSATVGSTVSGSIGTWGGTQPIAYSFTWIRCDSAGNNCRSIVSTSSQTYVLAAADAGSTIELVVKGSNPMGSSVAVSAPTPVITNELPGAIRLDSGRISVPASSISLPNRIVVAHVGFSRHPLRSRHVFTARVRITDAHGHVVRGALVHVLGIPYGWIANAHDVATSMDGYAIVKLHPTRRLPLHKGNALVLAVRARRPGDSTLAGVSAHRLVQLQLAAPRG